ncbi:MAG: polysaccharide biosynthesis protein [Nocardioidaceae bacterium]
MAEQLIELSGKPIEITYTGLREGEKLDEELFGEGEVDVRPIHPLISHAHVPPSAPARRPFSMPTPTLPRSLASSRLLAQI